MEDVRTNNNQTHSVLQNYANQVKDPNAMSDDESEKIQIKKIPLVKRKVSNEQAN